MPHESYFAAVRQPDQTVNQLFRLLGARLEQAANGAAQIALAVCPALTQGVGMIAGGVLAALADEAMAHAVMSLAEDNQRFVTLEMNIRYLRAADPAAGGEITARGAVLKRGRTVMFAEARIMGPDGALLAVAGGSFAFSPPPCQKK